MISADVMLRIRASTEEEYPGDEEMQARSVLEQVRAYEALDPNRDLVEPTEDPAEVSKPSLAIDLDVTKRITYAAQQNGLPLLHRLRLTNSGENDFKDFTLRVRGEPDFCVDWTRPVDRLRAGHELTIEDIDLRLSPSFLVNLTEAVRGRLWVEVVSGEEVLHRAVSDVELLAYDEWPGAACPPEILAAFVMPNHPAIERVLIVASDLLGKATGQSSLEGYQQEDPKRVWAIANAIYRAVAVLQIEYVNPPASFESSGQKIRTPDRVVEGKRGTCLDLTVLMAACMEQAGLRPWVVVVEGHAFPGVWLQEQSCSSVETDDVAALRKWRDLGEVVFFDSSSASRTGVDFEAAVAVANGHLRDDVELHFALDVYQARKLAGVRPIAGRVVEGGFRPLLEDAGAGVVDDGSWRPAEAPDSLSADRGEALGGAERKPLEGAAARLERWKRKLLDLSLRNRLLNFRDTKKTIPLLIPDLADFEDRLALGQRFGVSPLPALGGDTTVASLRSSFEAREPELLGALGHQIEGKQLHSYLTETELDRRLTEVHRAGKSSIEETGANTLFLALGFLKWFAGGSAAEPRMAPILLIPLEVKRGSARESFRLAMAGDETRVNHTLVEMLRQDFGIDLSPIEELPADDAGVDVPRILRTVRSLIRDVPGWDVVEDAWVGLFSFSKFLMWRDLADRAESLAESPVVHHLLHGKGVAFDADGTFVAPRELDQVAPTEIYCPLDADASQLSAVLSSEAGRSFVLWGPPGTGKSQTITNLIAQCLAKGKTVLFVAEKMAALNVVQSRLEKVGLGDFCLELHSSKARKADVLRQMRCSLEAVRIREPEEWQAKATRLEEVRRDLNAYAEALGRERSPGWSAFQVTSELIGMASVPHVDLRWRSVDEIDRENLEELRLAVRRVVTAGVAIGGPGSHPWRGVVQREWSSSWQSAVESALADLGGALRAVRTAAVALEEYAGVTAAELSVGQIEVSRCLCTRLLENLSPARALLEEPRWREAVADLRSAIDAGVKRDQLRGELAERFSDKLFALDFEELQSRLRHAEQSNPILRWFRRRPVTRALRAVLLAKGRIQPDDACEVLAKGLEAEAAHVEVDRLGVEAERLLGRDWRGGMADWALVVSLVAWAEDMRRVAMDLSGGDLSRRTELLSKWAVLASDGSGLLDASAPAGSALTSLRGALESLGEAWTHFVEVGRVESVTFLPEGDATSLENWQTRLEECTAAVKRLREWCAWIAAREAAVGHDLAPLIDGYESTILAGGELEAVFEASLRRWWLESVSESEPVLRGFFSPEHERKISDFQHLDKEALELATPLIRARLAAALPRAGADPSSGSELGILMREIQKKARHMPVRRLIEKIPHLLPRLKPCFLMSPLSVAQYLDTSLALFDVVVFDEASQIPVWDAIGALARGRQAVIAGDPKQLPPTSFFSKSDDPEDLEDAEVEDLESILDECLAARLPELKLDWHYRSRHESLIAFSNHHYYDGRLLIFPSPLAEGIGVKHRAVPEGVYDKGKSRTNRGEADALVQEIVTRLKDPEQCRYTIGVVTFSQAQQSLVEDLLDVARRKHPEIERFFGEGVTEAVFVKNLENVQGDERDVILFSIGYGPDSQGRVSMNFGALNRAGGERRLNVAITRARVELTVFSTLRSEQIDTNRTMALGVHHLKFFLEFAERGPDALDAATFATGEADFDSPFEREVCRALEDRGHRVVLQVGCAGYRVDLAIVDPISPGRYLLGIECDGATYHRSRTARERDRLREGVLRGLGWNIHRVWSTDWWHDRDHQLDAIEEALVQARLSPPGRPGPTLEAQEARGSEPEEKSASYGAKTEVPGEKSETVRDAPTGDTEFSLGARAAPFESHGGDVPASDAEVEVYTPANLPMLANESDDLYEAAAVPKVRALFAQLVEEEAPVSLEFALRRVGEAWGLGRVTKRAQKRLLDILKQTDIHSRDTSGIDSLWKSAEQADGWSGYRAHTGSDERTAYEIPAEEIAAAAQAALETNISLERSELEREAARCFGFSRMGRVLQERMGAGVDVIIERGVATETEGWVRLARQ